MSAHPGAAMTEQVLASINEPKSEAILEQHPNGCPISREILHRLEIPAVVGVHAVVDAGTVCLSRDDFCAESVHCALCRFVVKERPAGTNSASQISVHFILDECTNIRLRRWIYPQAKTQTPPLTCWGTLNLMIALADEASWFKKAYYGRFEAYYVSEGEYRELPVLRLWKYQTVNRNPPEPKPDTLTYIVKQAKQWLSHCDARHEVCRSLSSNSTPPISLIDCNQHCLVHGLQGMRYVALSYVWGKTGRDFNLPERRYGVPLDGLPRTISDAIAVAKSLEYDFLWVDMICIDQRSNEDKLRQMAIMYQIYRSADLTIIVAAGSDCGNGIPGVSEMPRPPRTSTTIGNTMLVEEKVNAIDEVKASIWRSRGWTLQEGLLSRRRLVFTDCQMLFSCLSGQETEPREGPEFQDNVGDIVWNDESDGSSPSASTIMAQSQKDKLWDTSVLQTDSAPRTALIGHQEGYPDYGFPIAMAELLESYSKMHFSFELDILHAFRAIGNIFAQRKPPVLHLCGLPFICGNESITARSLTRGLAWCLERDDEETARRPGFPSWSWLGYRGPVRWGALRREGLPEHVHNQWIANTFSHVRSMITIGNMVFEPLQLSQWWRDWSSGKASEGLAPQRLLILGARIKQEIWLECMEYKPWWTPPGCHSITGKEGWQHNMELRIGDSRLMSADACLCLLEKLRRGSWRALVLTAKYLLIIQPMVASAKAGPYRRVAGTEINAVNKRKRCCMDEFVEKYTELVDIELE